MRLLWRLAVPLLLMLWVVPAAWADHMNGTYSGTGEAAGTTLQLHQSGRMLTGQLSGQTQGTLTGQSDGGDNAMGSVSIEGTGQLQFQAQWSQAGLTIQLSGPGGTEQYFFAAGGSTQTPTTPQLPQNPPQLPQTPPPAPAPPPPPVATGADYYLLENGQQAGPFSLQQVLKRIDQGALQAEDLIWKTGIADWVQAGTLPELVGDAPTPPNGPPPPPGPQSSTDDLPTTGPAVSQEQLTKSAILIGATLSILSHELGHAMIGEFGIPSTGAEEDTADQFAALIMSSITSDDQFADMAPEGRNFVTDMVRYSTLLWFYDAQKSAKTGLEIPWYDEHSASETRFRNTLCTIYGSAPAIFAPLADEVGLPERERGRCEVDFAKGYRAWETIIAPYARNLGGDYPGELPADAKGAKVRVRYEPSASETGRVFSAAFQQVELFEGLAQQLETLLVWNRDFAIVFADCGEPNAFYDPSKAQVTMCWEGIEHFYWTIAEPEGFQRPAA